MIKEMYNRSKNEIVEDLGLCEAIYEGYIDSESELGEESYIEMYGEEFDDYEWLCKIFQVW